MITIPKEKYKDLERELGFLRCRLPYQELKTAVIETYVVGRMVSVGAEHLVMAETLGLSKKAVEDLKELYSAVIMPLQERLDATKATVLDGSAVMHLSPSDQEVAAAKTLLGDKIIASIPHNQLRDASQIKAVILYPLLLATLNTWRKYDLEFADRIIKAVKANEPDERIRITMEQIDFVDTAEQLKRN